LDNSKNIASTGSQASSLSRLQVRLVAASYAAVAGVSALLIFWRYLQYVRNPQDAAASSGMWAGGDLALELIICFLFLVPTAVLVFVIRKSEPAYTAYAKMLLGLSLTGPMSLAFMAVPFLNQWYWGDAVVFRLFAMPIVFFVLILSWLLTRFPRARRLIFYALLVEGLTFVVVILGAAFLFSKGSHS
jgi:hypothetical protein